MLVLYLATRSPFVKRMSGSKKGFPLKQPRESTPGAPAWESRRPRLFKLKDYEAVRGSGCQSPGLGA